VEDTTGENRRKALSMPLLQAENKQKPEEWEESVWSVARGLTDAEFTDVERAVCEWQSRVEIFSRSMLFST
jgi:hypothetical protein